MAARSAWPPVFPELGFAQDLAVASGGTGVGRARRSRRGSSVWRAAWSWPPASGSRCGERIRLPIERWRSPGSWGRVTRCTGPMLDTGCRLGRLTIAMVNRGVTALGVDISPVAVRLTASAGHPAERVRVPARETGLAACVAGGPKTRFRWNPVRLPRRVYELLCAGRQRAGATESRRWAQPGSGRSRHAVVRLGLGHRNSQEPYAGGRGVYPSAYGSVSSPSGGALTGSGASSRGWSRPRPAAERH